MAYRIIIELDKDLDLQIATSLYSRIMGLISKETGFVVVKEITLEDKESFKPILEYRQGYYLKDAIEKWKNDKITAHFKHEVKSTTIDSIENTDEDAIN